MGWGWDDDVPCNMYTSLMLRLCVCRATEIMVGVSWNEQKRLRKVSWKFEGTDFCIFHDRRGESSTGERQ